MTSLMEFLKPGSVAHAVMVLSLVASVGLFIGHLKVFRVRVGIIGVLFAGLFFGHLGFAIHYEIMDFAREFGLILFVYTIGMQVGPGFLAALRRHGLLLGTLAITIVFTGALIAWAIGRSGQVPVLAAVGLYSGAVTNTPSLGAAQQVLKDMPTLTPELLKLPGLGYALAYPFGILGIILVMLLLRLLFRIKPSDEAEAFAMQQHRDRSPITTMNLEVANKNLEGQRLVAIPTLKESGIVVSRIWHDKHLTVARGDTVVHVGDVLLAVGPEPAVEALRVVVGHESHLDLRAMPSTITAQRVLVTETAAVGGSLAELNLGHRYGVAVTRVIRGEVELAATPDLRLQFGDRVQLVGESHALEQVTEELGNSVSQLNQAPVLPIFIGLVLGVVVGVLPFQIPGVPGSLRLGMAGGPLIVAMLLARWGKVGPVIWYLPVGASFVLRELGITLFLSCVGLKAGDQFVATLLGGGWTWVLWGALITAVPLFLAGVVARLFFRTNYLTICGLLAGSMTDPPALSFAGSITTSDAPAIAYATVYPLVMLLRVLTAQILALLAIH